jgi:hypothetical protein
MQLWLVSKGPRVVGAITTELICYPNKRHCRIVTLAGSEYREWTELVNKRIESWAKENGCDALEAYVRKGFTPKLVSYGFKHKHSVMIKIINNG